MKNIIITALLLASAVTNAQKKTNGTIYVEHPAIATVEAMNQAFVEGSVEKVASFLADDFKSFEGTSTNRSDKGQDKAAFLKNVPLYKNDVDYLSISRSQGAYPDALEYKDPNSKDVVWVQTWEDMKGVDKKTGVKIDMPMHRLFTVDKNNKIKTMISYMNSTVGNEIGESHSARKNGEIYNHHENINSVRKMMSAYEHKDFSKAYLYYDEEVKFIDNNRPIGSSLTLTQQKANDQKMLEAFNILRIEITGYPDYLHYELGDQRVVQSWWTFHLQRKSDKKNIDVPVFIIDNFNDKGKITSELVYYSEKLLEAK